MTVTRVGTRVVFGLRPVVELLRARPDEVQAVFVATGRHPDAKLSEALEAASLEPDWRGSSELERLAEGANHQGVLAVVGAFPYLSLEALLARAQDHPEQPLVVLDQIQDPRNLGAILRSAYALGAAGAVLPGRRAAGVTAVVVRASAGATEHLPIAQVTNLARALAQLKEAGYWLVGAVGAGDADVDADSDAPPRPKPKARSQPPPVQPPEALDLKSRVGLVLGSEGKGLRRTTREACDFLVTIPMAGGLDSLNVSVAAGILLAEAARQRRQT